MLWVFGWAYLLVRAARSRLLPRWLTSLGASLVVVCAMSPTVLLALSGRPLPTPIHPELFALKPAGHPAAVNRLAVQSISREHLPVLWRMDVDTRLSAPGALTAALLGFDAAVGGGRDPLELPELRCPDDEAAERLRDDEGSTNLTWEYFGSVASVACPDRSSVEWLCGFAGEESQRSACIAGYAGW